LGLSAGGFFELREAALRQLGIASEAAPKLIALMNSRRFNALEIPAEETISGKERPFLTEFGSGFIEGSPPFLCSNRPISQFDLCSRNRRDRVIAFT
jgi:hypothetical protein